MSGFRAKVGEKEIQLGLSALSARNEKKRRTICNVLRRVYISCRGGAGSGDEVDRLLAEAIYMAKQMSKKLQEYAGDSGRYDVDGWADLPEGFLDDPVGERLSGILQKIGEVVPSRAPYYDTAKGRARARAFVSGLVPEVQRGGLFIVEVGPGTGFLMKECVGWGNAVLGIEAATDSRYSKLDGARLASLYEMSTSLMGLTVLPLGFEHVLETGMSLGRKVDVVIMQGSFGVMSVGTDLCATVGLLCGWLARNLAAGGFAVISFNDAGKLEAESLLERQIALRYEKIGTRVCRLWRLGERGNER